MLVTAMSTEISSIPYLHIISLQEQIELSYIQNSIFLCLKELAFYM